MIRPDDVILASQLPAYVNVSTPTGSISLSGNITSGNTGTFTTTLAYSISDPQTMGDVYGVNNTTGYKFLLNNLLVATANVEYKPTSSELCQMSLSYSAGVLTVTYSIFNGTGGTITVPTQTVTINAPIYQIPF